MNVLQEYAEAKRSGAYKDFSTANTDLLPARDGTVIAKQVTQNKQCCYIYRWVHFILLITAVCSNFVLLWLFMGVKSGVESLHMDRQKEPRTTIIEKTIPCPPPPDLSSKVIDAFFAKAPAKGQKLTMLVCTPGEGCKTTVKDARLYGTRKK